jgi:hypothetical protein
VYVAFVIDCYSRYIVGWQWFVNRARAVADGY